LAQKPPLPVIGVLGFGWPETNVAAAFHKGLNEIGYRRSNSAGRRMTTPGWRTLAADLVRRQVALIVTLMNYIGIYAFAVSHKANRFGPRLQSAKGRHGESAPTRSRFSGGKRLPSRKAGALLRTPRHLTPSASINALMIGSVRSSLSVGSRQHVRLADFGRQATFNRSGARVQAAWQQDPSSEATDQ
jgi:hypothetical protein